MTNSNKPEWFANADCPDDKREALVHAWISSVYRLHNQSVGAVRKTLSWDIYYIETYSGLGVPVVSYDGKWGLRYWLNRKEDGFVFVPLVRSDERLHPFFKSMLYRPAYREQPRAIYLPAARVSYAWRVILIHHELGHTMFHRLNIYRDHKMGHWAEEYEVYKSEFKLLSRLYGRPYSRLVYDLSRKYELGLSQGRMQVSSETDVSPQQLGRILGKPQSKFEYRMQRGVVMLNAMYRALDRLHKDGDKTEHYAITKWFYAANENKYMYSSDEA